MFDFSTLIAPVVTAIFSGIAGSALTIYVQRRRDTAMTSNERDANYISFAEQLRERVETLENNMTRKDEQVIKLQSDNKTLQSQYDAVVDRNARLELEVRALRAAYQEMIVRQEHLVALLRKTGQPLPAPSTLDIDYLLSRESETSITPPENTP